MRYQTLVLNNNNSNNNILLHAAHRWLIIIIICTRQNDFARHQNNMETATCNCSSAAGKCRKESNRVHMGRLIVFGNYTGGDKSIICTHLPPLNLSIKCNLSQFQICRYSIRMYLLRECYVRQTIL